MNKKKVLIFASVAVLALGGCDFLFEDEDPVEVVVSDNMHTVDSNDQAVDEPNNNAEISTGAHSSGSADETADEGNEDTKFNPDSDGGASGYFTTEDLDGNVVTQEIFTESKYTFVNIWGTYCGPCINEMPDLGELANEYDKEDIQFIGIVCDVYSSDDSALAKKIINKTGAYYTHLVCNQDIVDWYLNDVEAVPTTLIIDSEGNILYETIGSQSKNQWKTLINSYLTNQE